VTPLFTVKAELEHLAIITWPARADDVAAILPRPLIPQTIDRARKWALISMAVMRDTTFGETYAQLNERAYAMLPDGTGKGAFFWRSQVAATQAIAVRALVGAPEFVADLSIDVRGDDYVFRRERRVVARLDLGRRGAAPARYADIDRARALRMSSGPKIGYTVNWGRLCSTRVLRSDVRARSVAVVRVDPSFMLPSIAIDERDLATPLSAVYVRRTPFWVDAPPRPVAVAERDRVMWRLFTPWRC
jgi:hypothetical protein